MSSPNSVNNPDFRIAETLLGLAGHHRASYCFPSQEKLLDLIKRFTGRVMSRRTLNRHLAALARGGWVTRLRRHQVQKHKGMVFRSTLYRIGGRYLARLRRMNEGIGRLKAALGRSSSNIRVPRAAQYANSFLKILIGPGVIHSPAPPKAA